MMAYVAKNSFRAFARRRDDSGAPDGYPTPHAPITYSIAPERRYADHFSEVTPQGEVAVRLRSLIFLAVSAITRNARATGQLADATN
jgi:hypothetical protein